ncbi:uncharacterized protein LOC129322167 isoform X2 [Prosopis cineraria]|uniref:uncharacterized protein LOC129322167 isoform X2 n=1 Tax=Prosopis cineraria TaxID=364024 RepID=UPI00240FF192|nr:uncharacterized protein LOC129322167 isoform X2 [Prosopis cineraria]XP_054824247.1 uncharacterized protein LOC129322167 isoform X2 [Prosopis cineraria]
MHADSVVNANCPDKGYLQQSVYYTSETLPSNSQDDSDVQNGTTGSISSAESSPKSLTSENLNDLKSTDINDDLTSESPESIPDTKMEKKIIMKVPFLEFNFSAVGLPRLQHPIGKSTSIASQKRPVLPPINSTPNGRTPSINDRPMTRDKLTWNPQHEKSRELTHGPLLASQKRPVLPPINSQPNGRTHSINDRPMTRDKLTWNPQHEKTREPTHCPSFASQKRHVYPATSCHPIGRAQSLNDIPMPLSRDKLNSNARFEKSPELTYGPSLASDKHVFLPPDFQPWGGTQSTNDRPGWSDKTVSKDQPSWSTELEMSPELIRGPRCYDRNLQSEPSSVKQTFGFSISRDKYNLQEFQTQYENANFYVLKSFNEDDIHKSIKYNVWTSTSVGNKKLNAAFLDAEAKSRETGKKCPVFLFFSVNGSGQFVGVAEMIGPVDFNKDMRFWKGKKFYGFFPIRWHIIKDVPNTQFRYIVLPNNDNKPVTYSRDTQEVGLKQGMEMLNIFKRFLAKTSLLDDYDFYTNRDPKKKGVSCSK